MGKVAFPLLTAELAQIRVDASNVKKPLPEGYIFDDFLYDLQTVVSFPNGKALSLTSARLLVSLWELPLRSLVVGGQLSIRFDAGMMAVQEQDRSYLIHIEAPEISQVAAVSREELISWIRHSFGIVSCELANKYQSNVLPSPIEAYFSTIERIYLDTSSFPLTLT